MLGRNSDKIEGSSCVTIIHPDSIDSFLQAASIKEGDIWHGEVNCLSTGGGTFPASITVNKFFLGGDVFLHIIVCNITDQKAIRITSYNVCYTKLLRVTIFGKSWDIHVKDALNIELTDNLLLIEDSLAFLCGKVEHLFYRITSYNVCYTKLLRWFL